MVSRSPLNVTLYVHGLSSFPKCCEDSFTYVTHTDLIALATCSTVLPSKPKISLTLSFIQQNGNFKNFTFCLNLRCSIQKCRGGGVQVSGNLIPVPTTTPLFSHPHLTPKCTHLRLPLSLFLSMVLYFVFYLT